MTPKKVRGKQNQRSVKMILPKTWSDCERGNIWLCTEEMEKHLAYFRMPGKDNWLEVSLVPENYPGFNVGVINLSEKGLAAHIQARCDGWVVRKMNISGVKVKDNYVDSEGDDTE
jgi:hypothetical protein